MIGSRELEALQVELKKAIQNHHLIRLKLAQESSDSLKDHLKNIQNHIQHLGEKQKRIIAQLREKESSSSSSSSSSRPALAVRTISGETKLLVLVSAAAATAKQKQNQHQQILVVPTPGGGARLATSALSNCSGTLLRHPLRSNGFNSNNSNGCNNNGGSSSGYLNTHQNTSNGNTSGSSYKSVLGGGSSSGCSSVGGGEGSTSGGISIKSTSNQLQQNITRQQLQREQLARQAQLEEERVSEPKRKEGFLAALGLVTKEALTEIQNKKCERKRRTTANPQFSNAAIEAKRISALAVAEKRAKRRMLLGQEAAAASGRGGANNGTNGSRRNFLQSSSSSSSSTTTSTSRNRAQKLRGACAVEQPQPVRQRSGGPGGGGGSSSGRRLDREKSSTTNHSASNGADASTKSAANSNSTNGGGSLSGSKVPKNCFVCDELCDADLDAIMFCKDCRCLFHATCAADIANIKQNLSVPCPKCDKQKPLEEEVLSAPSEESAVSPSGHESAADETELRSVKQEDEKTEEDDEEEAAAAAEQLDDKAEEEEEEDEDEEEERRRPKKGAGEVSGAKVQAESGHTEDDEDNEKEAAEAAAKAKAEDEMEKKLLEEKKVKKDELKRKRDSLDDEVDQCKKRLAELKETLSVEKDHQENLIKEQTVLIDNISKVTSIVELVKNSVPIKVECETEMSSAPMTTGDDDHQSSPSKDTDNTVCTKASDILKTLADGIGRMVPEDKDGVVYDETGSSGSSSGGGVVHTGEEVHVDNILGKDNMEFHPSVNIINSHVDQQPHQTFRIQNGMVIVGTKALEVIVMDTTSGPGTGKLDQFEDETSAAVASIQGIQDQIEVDFREELLH